MTSVGVMASAVSLPSGVDVLIEPFNNFTFAPWTLTSTPTIVAGRNGNGAQTSGPTQSLRYAIAAGNQVATITIGMAWRTPVLQAGGNLVFNLASDTNATNHTGLSVDSTGALNVQRAGTGLVSSSSGLIAVNTWYYLEARYTLGDAPNGVAVVRLNGAEVINSVGLDTKNAGTKTVYDTVRLGPTNGSTGGIDLYDDLYIVAGSGFKGDIVVP